MARETTVGLYSALASPGGGWDPTSVMTWMSLRQPVWRQRGSCLTRVPGVESRVLRLMPDAIGTSCQGHTYLSICGVKASMGEKTGCLLTVLLWTLEPPLPEPFSQFILVSRVFPHPQDC